MTTQIQRRRGTTAQHSTFTGAVGEVTVDTDKEVLVVHDGAQVGGYPQMRENGSNSALALGSAGTPSLKFTGDTNTGIYSPGADQVAISTGGSGRLFVDASGNVGVGAAPNSLFHVSGNGVAQITRSSRDLFLNANFDGANTHAALQTSSGMGLALYTNGANERLRITSAGLVGVGTSSPGALLDVAGSADVRDSSGFSFDAGNKATLNIGNYVGYGASGGSLLTLGIQNTNAMNAGAVFRYTFGLSGNASGQRLTLSSVIRDGTATERLCVDSSGRLGIGTTSPAATIETASANVSGDDNLGNVYIRTTDAQGSNIGGKLTLGGLYNASATYAFAGIAGRKENATSNNVAGYLQFLTTTSAGALSERARIDSSGRLLVGTSTARSNVRFTTDNKTPTVQFETAQNDYVGLSVINNSNAGYPANVWIGSANGTSVGSNGLVGNQTIGNINFVGADGTNLIHAARIHVDTDGTTGSGDMPARLVFSTTADGASSPTERMRITNGGIPYFLSTLDGPTVSTTAAAGTSEVLYLGRHSATAGVVGSGTLAFRVYTNGNVQNTNNSYGAISDIKLKENVVDAGSQWDDIKALQVRNYNLKEGQTHRQIGLIAQEVEPISPGLVYESPDRDADGNDLGTVTKSVNYSVLYMKAVKALQEAMERIETLEAKVAALESA